MSLTKTIKADRLSARCILGERNVYNMKVSELIDKLDLEILTNKTYADHEISGCYIGDLLSWVMGRAVSGNVWITIMNNINIVAVAALTDAACIILCEGVTADEDIVDKANSEEIIILKSDKTAYELACSICKMEI